MWAPTPSTRPCAAAAWRRWGEGFSCGESPPSVGFFMNWVLSRFAAVQKLTKLLDCRFVPNSLANETVIGRLVYFTIVFHNEGDFLSRDLQILRLHFLAKHLEEVRAKDRVIFDSLKRDLLKKDKCNAGVQFELEIAASVLRKNLVIEKTERPDFRLSFCGRSFGLECSSSQYSSEGNKGALEKIAGVVRKKQRLRYCNTQTALLINVSSLKHGRDFPDRDLIERSIRAQHNGKRYGSVLLFCVIYQQEQIQSVYMRFDHEGIDPDLISLLDVIWPKGSLELKGHYTYQV